MQGCNCAVTRALAKHPWRRWDDPLTPELRLDNHRNSGGDVLYAGAPPGNALILTSDLAPLELGMRID
jgi:hypothetical protein